jgi:hypothetical protein
MTEITPPHRLWHTAYLTSSVGDLPAMTNPGSMTQR